MAASLSQARQHAADAQAAIQTASERCTLAKQAVAGAEADAQQAQAWADMAYFAAAQLQQSIVARKAASSPSGTTMSVDAAFNAKHVQQAAARAKQAFLLRQQAAVAAGAAFTAEGAAADYAAEAESAAARTTKAANASINSRSQQQAAEAARLAAQQKQIAAVRRSEAAE